MEWNINLVNSNSESEPNVLGKYSVNEFLLMPTQKREIKLMLLYTIVTAFDTINTSSLVNKESQKGLKRKREE